MGWLSWVGAIVIVAWLVDIVRRRAQLRRGQLAAWLLIVIILPVLGTILYFAVGRRPQV